MRLSDAERDLLVYTIQRRLREVFGEEADMLRSILAKVK